MLPIYLGCLIFGGGLLAVSVLFGGDHDADADVDMDVDADVDADLDHDVDHDLGGTADALWLPLLSLRFWIFFLAFFGLTGLLLDGLNLASTGLAGGVAAGMGLFAGYTVSRLIRALKQDSVSSAVEPERDYVGKSGTVLLDIEPGDPGQVRLEVKGSLVDLAAEPLADGGPLRRGAKVIVVAYEGGRLRVAPFDTGEPDGRERLRPAGQERTT